MVKTSRTPSGNPVRTGQRALSEMRPTSTWPRQVVQIFNLRSRRFPFGTRLNVRAALGLSTLRRLEALRYGTLKICASARRNHAYMAAALSHFAKCERLMAFLLGTFLLVGSRPMAQAEKRASATNEAAARLAQLRPQVKIVQDGESKTRPEDCRATLVGPGGTHNTISLNKCPEYASNGPLPGGLSGRLRHELS